MLKRALLSTALLAALSLAACGSPEAPKTEAAKPADNFLTKLQADYPVALSMVWLSRMAKTLSSLTVHGVS